MLCCDVKILQPDDGNGSSASPKYPYFEIQGKRWVSWEMNQTETVIEFSGNLRAFVSKHILVERKCCDMKRLQGEVPSSNPGISVLKQQLGGWKSQDC